MDVYAAIRSLYGWAALRSYDSEIVFKLSTDPKMLLAANDAENRTITLLLTRTAGQNWPKPVDFRVEIVCYSKVNGMKSDRAMTRRRDDCHGLSVR
jgi:hypothetical protein